MMNVLYISTSQSLPCEPRQLCNYSALLQKSQSLIEELHILYNIRCPVQTEHFALGHTSVC